MQQVLKSSSAALDLMAKMLTFNPHKRISVEDALDHEYFKSLRIEESEITCDKVFNFDFEKMKLTVNNLQECMFDEISLFRPYLKKTARTAPPTPQK
eukprot:1391858-Amorphochlora_amoeboformis.AAC.1